MATNKNDGIAHVFESKDGTVRKKSRFILGFSAVTVVGDRQLALVSPSVAELEIAWLDIAGFPLDKEKVQRVGIVCQRLIV